MKNSIIRHFKIIFPLAHFLAVLILVLLLFRTYNATLLVVKDQFTAQQLLVAQQTAVGMEKTITMSVKELHELSKENAIITSDIKESRKAIRKKFEHMKYFNINDAGLLDTKGIIKVSISAPHFEGAYFLYRELFKKIRGLKTPTVLFETITLKVAEKEQKALIVAMPLFSPDAEFTGALFFDILILEVTKDFIPLDSPESAFWLIDAKGTILYNSHHQQGTFDDRVDTADPPSRAFLEAVKSSTAAQSEYLSPQGDKAIAATYPLRVGNLTWSLMISTPEGAISTLLKSSSARYTLAIIIVLLLVASTSFLIIYLINKWSVELDSIVKARSKELSLSEAKLRRIVETINDLFWEADRNGTYTYVSPTAKKIIGYNPQELVGKTIFDIMPEEDAQTLRENLQKLVTTKQPFHNLERKIVNKAGALIVFETNGAPILDEKGNLLGVRGADRDITLRKHNEKELQKYAVQLEEVRSTLEHTVEERTMELRKAHESLIRKEKLAVLGELAGSVSHELRNPLGVIKNAIYFFKMRMHTFDDEEVKENIELINKEITTANKIIYDLLDFTRDKSPVRLEVNLNQLVQEMLSKSPIPDTVRVLKDLAEFMVPIAIDPTQIAQVFSNLIENALQAMGEGGTLRVATRADNTTVAVIFTDNGCGIPQDNLEKIFDPLFTTKTKGIGLGLVIAKNLVEANGGTVTVKSDGRSGTTFTVLFPRKA
jgi:PAS domain S-box-containing protein